jgi:copper chaperone CopZ
MTRFRITTKEVCIMRVFRMVAALAVATSLATVAASAQDTDQDVRQIEVTILGMSCPFCAYGVQQKLARVEGVADLNVELSTGLATLTMEASSDASNDLLLEIVDEAGFEVTKIVRSFDSDFPDWTPGGSRSDHPVIAPGPV